MKVTKIRVRFAPSPTGNLHIGGVRTALFNYAFAKKNGGQFILRIEDTDKVRSKPEFEKSIIDGLRWLGLIWDEGPDIGGPKGPYRQSERFKIYQKYINKLIEEDKAYPCFCTPEELEKKRKEMLSKGIAPKYDGKCRNLSKEERKKLIAKGKPFSIRFKVPPKKIIFYDLIRGKIEFDTSLLGDLIIRKSDGYPTYNFACVIDDALMDITHIIRGEDHISNTPKQILLFEALGFKIPTYAHLPIILGPDRSKLSKRHGATNVVDYKKEGYLAEALVNFLSLLGWSHPEEKEIFTLEEMIKVFSFDRINKSGAVFDITKLNWINSQYIKNMSDEKYIKYAKEFIKNTPILNIYQGEKLKKLLLLAKTGINKFSELSEKLKVFYEMQPFSEKAKKFIREKNINLEEFCKIFLETFENSNGNLIKTLKEVSEKTGLKGKNLYMTLRISITGTTEGFELQPLVEILGNNEIKRRIADTLKSHNA